MPSLTFTLNNITPPPQIPIQYSMNENKKKTQT